MKTKILLVATATVALMTVSCQNAESPVTGTTKEPTTEVSANTPSIGKDQVQGSWEIISITGEGANFEMLKGIVLKFDLDTLKITQNTNESTATYFIMNGELHYTVKGLNEVVEKISMVDENLQFVNAINQTLTYKKIKN